MEALKAFPAEREVFISGYEGDFNQVAVVRGAFLHVKPDDEKKWDGSFGPFGTHREGDAPWPAAIILEERSE